MTSASYPNNCSSQYKKPIINWKSEEFAYVIHHSFRCYSYGIQKLSNTHLHDVGNLTGGHDSAFGRLSWQALFQPHKH